MGVNGEVRAFETVRIDPLDLGLHRGYAVFDYFPVRNGQAWFIEDYLRRLRRSATAMGLEAGLPFPRALRLHLRQLAEANELQHGGIKLLLSGGPSTDGYTIASPTLYTYALPTTPVEEAPGGNGIKIFTLAHARESPGIKTTNYAAAMRQQRSVIAAGGSEVVYHDGGYISEASRSNVLCVTAGGQVWVPPTESALPGITRKHTVAVARELGLTVLERSLPLSELLSATEVAITGSSRGVVGVTAIADAPVGDGEVGATTRALAAAYLARGAAHAGW